MFCVHDVENKYILVNSLGHLCVWISFITIMNILIRETLEIRCTDVRIIVSGCFADLAMELFIYTYTIIIRMASMAKVLV